MEKFYGLDLVSPDFIFAVYFLRWQSKEYKKKSGKKAVVKFVEPMKEEPNEFQQWLLFNLGKSSVEYIRMATN